MQSRQRIGLGVWNLRTIGEVMIKPTSDVWRTTVGGGPEHEDQWVRGLNQEDHIFITFIKKWLFKKYHLTRWKCSASEEWPIAGPCPSCTGRSGHWKGSERNCTAASQRCFKTNLCLRGSSDRNPSSHKDSLSLGWKSGRDAPCPWLDRVRALPDGGSQTAGGSLHLVLAHWP